MARLGNRGGGPCRPLPDSLQRQIVESLIHGGITLLEVAREPDQGNLISVVVASPSGGLDVHASLAGRSASAH